MGDVGALGMTVGPLMVAECSVDGARLSRRQSTGRDTPASPAAIPASVHPSIEMLRDHPGDVALRPGIAVTPQAGELSAA